MMEKRRRYDALSLLLSLFFFFIIIFFFYNLFFVVLVKITNKPWRKYFFLKLFTFFISKLIFDINENIPRKIKYTAPINLTNLIIWSSAGEIKLKPRAKSRINTKTPN